MTDSASIGLCTGRASGVVAAAKELTEAERALRYTRPKAARRTVSSGSSICKQVGATEFLQQSQPDSLNLPPVGKGGADRAAGCASASVDCGTGRKTA